MIEKVLEDEPCNRQANLVLKQAALAAGWPEIGVFALQTLLDEKPGDTRILHELGRLYHELGDSEKEAEIYHRITEIDPLDAEADRLGPRCISPCFHKNRRMGARRKAIAI